MQVEEFHDKDCITRYSYSSNSWFVKVTFRQGSFGETFYIILDGKVQVSQKQKGYIRTLSGSDYFGEKALLNEASVRYWHFSR